MVEAKQNGIREEHRSGAEDRALPRIAQKAKSADDKLVTFVRDRPVVALCAAVALGYMVGRVFSKLA